MSAAKFLSFLVLAIFMISAANAFVLKPNESHTETVAGKLVTVEMIGLDTESNTGDVFLIVNGNLIMLENGTEETINGTTIALANVIYSDDHQSGVAYISLLGHPACDDGIMNNDETDIDCGGSCKPCSNGKKCSFSAECQSSVCSGGICVSSFSCNDGTKNGGETDVDCGGNCQKCSIGKKCYNPNDCDTGYCQNNICTRNQQTAGNCFDTYQNNGETGVDCGGPCQKQCITVKNTTSICGVGCFVLNTECVCPYTINKSQQTNEAKAENTNEAKVEDKITNTDKIQEIATGVQAYYTVNVTNVSYDKNSGKVTVISNKREKLFGIFSVNVKTEFVIDYKTGKVLKQSKPRWAVFAI
ncbi:MAG: hypothetical protein EPN86_06065 [Nanoarchaeota archaeon]|nr:MAG: hypothetical protein EPN86_06065 [Nanoarchaeota archaeon]